MGLVFAFEAHIFPLADYQAKDVQRLSYGFVIFVETRCICRVRALATALLQQLLQQAWESAKNLQKQELLALTWRGLEGFLSLKKHPPVAPTRPSALNAARAKGVCCFFKG